MNISCVKLAAFEQYYENFRTELLPEILDGFRPRGHPPSLQCFQFPAGCPNICLDLTPISASPPPDAGERPVTARRKERNRPLRWKKGGRAADKELPEVWEREAAALTEDDAPDGAGRQPRKLNCPISESFEASLAASCKVSRGIGGRRSGAAGPASDVICNDATCSTGSSADEQQHRRLPIATLMASEKQMWLFLVATSAPRCTLEDVNRGEKATSATFPLKK